MPKKRKKNRQVFKHPMQLPQVEELAAQETFYQQILNEKYRDPENSQDTRPVVRWNLHLYETALEFVTMRGGHNNWDAFVDVICPDEPTIVVLGGTEYAKANWGEENYSLLIACYQDYGPTGDRSGIVTYKLGKGKFLTEPQYPRIHLILE